MNWKFINETRINHCDDADGRLAAACRPDIPLLMMRNTTESRDSEVKMTNIWPGKEAKYTLQPFED